MHTHIHTHTNTHTPVIVEGHILALHAHTHACICNACVWDLPPYQLCLQCSSICHNGILVQIHTPDVQGHQWHVHMSKHTTCSRNKRFRALFSRHCNRYSAGPPTRQASLPLIYVYSQNAAEISISQPYIQGTVTGTVQISPPGKRVCHWHMHTRHGWIYSITFKRQCDSARL